MSIESMLQQLAQSQGRNLTEDELGLLQSANRPTNTQMAIQQIMNPPPPPQQMPQPQVLPQDMMVASAGGDPYGGVSTQTRKAMHEMGKADPTGEFGDAIINKQAPGQPAGYAAKTTVRGKQSASQEEQLVRMLMGRGMSEQEARARAKSF